MPGGVDSSVAAAMLVDEGHDVVGATLKLWGGPSDSGCCSVADVDDARRVAQQLGIEHHVFNLTDEFERQVIAPYIAEHVQGHTPNPCIECNRTIKFDRLLERADRLGFDRLATGHHARVTGNGAWRLRRGADEAKDQSYVLSMLGQAALARVVFPVGDLTKTSVSSPARRAEPASWPITWPSTGPRWSTARGAPPDRSTRSSWSPSGSDAAWDTVTTAGAATSPPSTSGRAG